MNNLLKKELGKVKLDKKVKIIFLLAMILQFTVFFHEYNIWKTEVGDVKEYTKIAKEYQGELDWSLIDESRLTDGDSYHDRDEDIVETMGPEEAFLRDYHRVAGLAKERDSYMDRLIGLDGEYPDKSFGKELEMMKDTGNLQYANNRGLNLFAQNITGLFSSLIFMIMPIVAVSYHNSVDRSSGFDQFIKSSKLGERAVERNKVWADYLYMIELVTIYYIMFLLLYMGLYRNFGALGYKLNTLGAFNSTIYDMTIRRYLVSSYFRLLLGTLTITALVTFIKRVFTKGIVGDILTLAILLSVLVLPKTGAISKIIALNPIIGMQGMFAHDDAMFISVFGKTTTYASLSFIVLGIAFVLLNVLILGSGKKYDR